MKNLFNSNRFFNFHAPRVKYFDVFLSFFPFAYKSFVSFFDDLFIQVQEIYAFITAYFRVVTQLFVITSYILSGKIIESFVNVYNHFLDTLIDFPLFNFITLTVTSLICLGYFVNDAELMLFFSCVLVIFIIGSYVNEILNTTLEEYSTSIVLSLFEKLSIQLDSYVFEKEMNNRLRILDEFLFYSAIFVEQQLSLYTGMQASLFSYHYSVITESNLVSEAEDHFTSEHIEALTAFVELEKFVATYLIFELLNDDYDL